MVSILLICIFSTDTVQSSPKVIVQIAIAGAQILGKAFVAAGRQAMKSMYHRDVGSLLHNH